jgi:hypothetical protein
LAAEGIVLTARANNTPAGSDGPYIVIGAFAVLTISAGIYAANTQIEQAPPGYRWAEQRGIDDEDYCPDGNKLFYAGCVAYVKEPNGAPKLARLGK